MTTIAPVDPGTPPHGAHDQHQHRAPVDFGGAVTHRDLVREKLRVDPASLASKKRAAADVRAGDPPRDNYDTEDPEPAGQYVDIEV